MICTAIASDDDNRLKERIASLLDLTLLAKGELHIAIYRAYLAGIPAGEIDRLGSLKSGELERIVDSFRTLRDEELEAELEAKELRWHVVGGFGTYG